MNERGTDSLRDFVVERNRLLGLTDLVIAKVVADFQEDLAQITGNVPPARQRPLPTMEELEEYKAKQVRYAGYVQLVHELTYCRIADSFLRYVAALLTGVLTAQPSLRTKSPGHAVTPVSEQVEAEVRSLTGGVQRFALEAKKRYGFRVFSSTSEESEIGRIVGIRNVFTHNHGILDHRALKRLGRPSSDFGQCLTLSPKDLGRALGVVSECVQALDVRAASTFQLPTQPVPSLRRTA
jgi:hypothetical protein